VTTARPAGPRIHDYGGQRVSPEHLRGDSEEKYEHGLPVIFDWMMLDELLAKAFCRSDIMARPGMKAV
jgi:hypothetical protein